MYYDMNDSNLQSWLLAESISDDAILGTEEEWQASQAFRDGEDLSSEVE